MTLQPARRLSAIVVSTPTPGVPQRAWTERTIQSLLDLLALPGNSESFEIVLVVGGSLDGTTRHIESTFYDAQVRGQLRIIPAEPAVAGFLGVNPIKLFAAGVDAAVGSWLAWIPVGSIWSAAHLTQLEEEFKSRDLVIGIRETPTSGGQAPGDSRALARLDWLKLLIEDNRIVKGSLAVRRKWLEEQDVLERSSALGGEYELVLRLLGGADLPRADHARVGQGGIGWIAKPRIQSLESPLAAIAPGLSEFASSAQHRIGLLASLKGLPKRYWIRALRGAVRKR